MLRRLRALTIKEFIQMLRDARSLPLILIGCAGELILFGMAVHTDIHHIPMVVVDQSRSAASQSYLAAFTNSGYFDLAITGADPLDANQAIDSGRAAIGVIIPPDFSQKRTRGNATALLLIDGSSAFTSQSAYRAAQAISQAYAVSLVQSQARGSLTADIQILYNPDLKDLWFIAPAFFALFLQAVSMNFTSLAVVREREAGTIEALLVTPIRPIELMIAKTAPYLVGSFLNTITLLVTSVYVLGLPFRGSLALFLALGMLNACCGLAMGLAISTLVNTQNQSQQLSSIVNISGMFLAGIMYPIYTLPLVLRLVSYLYSNTFFVPITRGIFLKGAGLAELWPQALAMAALLVGLLFVATQLFRQRLD